MPEYKDISLIVRGIEEGKKNLHFKNAENAEICAGVLAFVQGVIDRVPEADAVEIVRCKDCLYNENGICVHSESYDDTNHRPDHFCADGLRKEVQE